MAEPRATINPLELDKPMSMNEFEYEIAQQGFFEKNTTERDGTLQIYNRKVTEYRNGETSKNTVITKDGFKFTDNSIGGQVKLDVAAEMQKRAPHLIDGEILNAYYGSQGLWVVYNLRTVLLHNDGNVYHLDFAGGKMSAINTLSQQGESIDMMAFVVETRLYLVVFLPDPSNPRLELVQQIQGTFNFQGDILTMYLDEAANGYIMFSVFKEKINAPLSDDIFGETRVLDLSTSPPTLRDITYGALSDNNAVIYTGYNLTFGRKARANTQFDYVADPYFDFTLNANNRVTIYGENVKRDQFTSVDANNGSYTTTLGNIRMLQKVNGNYRLMFGENTAYLNDGRMGYRTNLQNVGYIADGNIKHNPYGYTKGQLLFNQNTLTGITAGDCILEPAFTIDKVTNIGSYKGDNLTYKIKDKVYVTYYDSEAERVCYQVGNNILTNNLYRSGYNLDTNLYFNAYNDFNNRIIPTCLTSGAVTQYAFVSAVNDDIKNNSWGASLAPSVVICEYEHPIDKNNYFIPYMAGGLTYYDKGLGNCYGDTNNLSMPHYLWSTNGDSSNKIELQNLKGTYYLGGGDSGLFYFSKVDFSDGDIGFIKGSGNFKLLEKEGRPILLYKSLSDVGVVDDLFVIQKQAFIIRNNCIYSIMFSNTDIADYEFVVNLGAVKFIGNTPNVAFFYNENTKQIYGFTGSSSVEFLFYGYKLKGLRKFFKNYSEMGIIVSTDERVFLIQGEDIFYRPIPKVDNVYFLNDRIVYLSESEGIVEESMQDIGGEWLPCHLKTLYIGGGRNDLQESNCWYLTVYNRQGLESGLVKMTSRVINQKTLESQEKVLELKSSDFTVEGLAFIRLQPQVQNTVGASVEIVSDFDIDYLALGFMGQGIQQISRFNV